MLKGFLMPGKCCIMPKQPFSKGYVRKSYIRPKATFFLENATLSEIVANIF